jgi:hypothetical protein
VDPRAGLDDAEKILDPTGTRTPTPLSPSLYPGCTWLRYPGSNNTRGEVKIMKLASYKIFQISLLLYSLKKTPKLWGGGVTVVSGVRHDNQWNTESYYARGPQIYKCGTCTTGWSTNHTSDPVSCGCVQSSNCTAAETRFERSLLASVALSISGRLTKWEGGGGHAPGCTAQHGPSHDRKVSGANAKLSREVVMTQLQSFC